MKGEKLQGYKVTATTSLTDEVTLTEAKVSDGLHLTQVPRAAINDPGVWATFFSVHHHFGSPGKCTKFGAGDHPQPGVGGALR